MIKIEKLKDGAKVFVKRDGERTQVFLNQLISHSEFNTIEVEGGTLVYSVDESEVLEIPGNQGKQLELNLTETVEDIVNTAEIVDTAIVPQETVATPTEAPTIVIPPRRSKK
jgi:hypothetical protein